MNEAGSRPKPSPASRFFGLLAPERSDIITILLFSVVNGVLLLATPLAVDALVNNIAFGGQQNVYIQALLILALALFAFLALLAVLRAGQHYVIEIVLRRLFLRVMADMAWRLPRVEVALLERTRGPELVNRFFEIVTVQKSSSLLLLESVNLVLSAVIGLVVLGFYHPFLLAFDIVLIAALLGIVFVMGRGAVRTSIVESYAKHDVAAWLEQIALFPLFFRSDGAAALGLQRVDELGHAYLEARQAHFRVLMRQIVGLLTLQAVASAALLTIGGALVLQGELTLGQLVASELIVGAIVASVAKFGKHLENWYDVMAAVDKLGSLVDLTVEAEGGEAPAERRAPAAVDLSQVRFGYDASPALFENFDLHLEPGTRVAVVGTAGCGASTLLDLLYGLKRPQTGMVRVDGLDLRHWDLVELRRDVALVRGTEIVEGTIVENVRLGRDHLSLDDVRRALESVGLMDVVLQLHDGMDTRLHPGGAPLSSSQRTRLVLARAVIGRPRLLLIDESLDSFSTDEVAELQAHLFDRGQPWTLVVVTQTEELVAACDEIVALAGRPRSRRRASAGSSVAP